MKTTNAALTQAEKLARIKMLISMSSVYPPGSWQENLNSENPCKFNQRICAIVLGWTDYQIIQRCEFIYKERRIPNSGLAWRSSTFYVFDQLVRELIKRHGYLTA